MIFLYFTFFNEKNAFYYCLQKQIPVSEFLLFLQVQSSRNSMTQVFFIFKKFGFFILDDKKMIKTIHILECIILDKSKKNLPFLVVFFLKNLKK